MNHRVNRLVWVSLAVAVAVAIGVAVAASGGGGSGGGASSGANRATGATRAVQQAPVTITGTPLPALPAAGADPAVGSTMPTLTGKSLFDGAALEIAPAGSPQVLAFVAHWCPHCNAEVPRLVDLAKAGVFDGVKVTAIATGTNSDYPNYPPSTWLKATMHWPFPALADSTSYQAGRAYGLTGYPFLVFVDAQGKVVARTDGELPSSVVQSYVAALKAGRPVAAGPAGASSSAS